MKRTKLLFSLLLISTYFVPMLYAATPSVDSTKVIYGCTNPKAINYNKYATKDNGTCVFDTTATVHMIYGCTDSTALNYNPLAKISNKNCIYKKTIVGCTDSLALNYNKKATADNGSCVYVRKIWGCTDSTALNYNPKATSDNGYCRYVAIVKGCTDKTAINYNPKANHDNKTCIFISNDSIAGCKDPYALNFNKYAKKSNGHCKYEYVTDTLRGCMDTLALNYSATATKPSKCVYTATTEILGCKSPKALNYNKNATKNDGSCVFAHPNNVIIPAIAAEITTITDTLGKVLQAKCSFDYTTPVDTAYIVKVTPLANKNLEVEWAVKQGTVTTSIKTVYSKQKTGVSLLVLSLVCNQSTVTTSSSTGILKVTAADNTAVTEVVKGVTLSAVYSNKVISDVTTTSANANGVVLYPNPVRDQLNVTYSSTTSDNLQLNIFSADGRRISSTLVNSVSGSNTFSVSTSGLKAGLHFMTITKDGSVINTVKFAKN